MRPVQGEDPIAAPADLALPPDSVGGWTADRVECGDAIELSNGRRIDVPPVAKGLGDARSWGAAILQSDPLVRRVGVNVGVSLHPGMLRAPDVAVLSEGGDAEWETVAPPLALEYAGPGRAASYLQPKLAELLEAGVGCLWLVHLEGPRRVEVHAPGHPMHLRVGGQHLEAPGVLANPVPVDALYEPEAAQRVILRNLVERAGAALRRDP